MSGHWHGRAIGLVALWGLVGSVMAAEQPGAQGPTVSTVPAFSFLAGEPVQAELKLDEPQKQKINQMIGEFQANMQKQAQANEAALRQLPVDERQARYQEMQAAANRRIQTFGQELEAALTPEQLQHLRRLAFLLNAGPSLGSPQLLEQLKAEPAQQKKIEQIQADAQNRLMQIQREMQLQMFQVQREMAEKAVETLTPEQRQLLEQMTNPPAPAPVKKGQ